MLRRIVIGWIAMGSLVAWPTANLSAGNEQGSELLEMIVKLIGAIATRTLRAAGWTRCEVRR